MADFPTSVYDPRTKANKAGVVYDANQADVGFAEDIQKLDAEVVAIEKVLSFYNAENVRFYFLDFLYPILTLANSPWLAAPILVGTVTLGTAVANHPGVHRFSSVATANSGYQVTSPTSQFLIGGGEKSQFVFSPVLNTNVTIRMGFFDSILVANPTDGVYFNSLGGLLTGKCASNTSISTTASNYQIQVGSWYRAQFIINVDGTRVDFYLYSESGVLLWSDYLETNIPTGAGRVTGHGVLATKSDGASAIFDIDYMDFVISRKLVR